MEEAILKCVLNHDIICIKKWLADLDIGRIQPPSGFDWWVLFEKLSKESFRGGDCNPELLELAIEVNDKARRYSTEVYTNEFTSIYLVIRALRVRSTYSSNVITQEYVLNKVRKKITATSKELSEAATNWKSLPIEEIRFLRQMKNWIKVIIELQSATGETYPEFADLILIRKELP